MKLQYVTTVTSDSCA